MSHRNIQPAYTLIEILVVIAIVGILIALLLPAVQAAREAARRLQCGSQMTQIGIATKQYEQAHGVLPMGTVNETGPIRNVPLGNHMGWISRILPYMEQIPLYEQIDFNKGVYDPVNQQVWASPKPIILSCPSDGNGYGNRHSSFMACSGGVETPIDIDNNGVFFLNSKLRSRDISDGTSNTIWFGEAPIFQDINNESRYYSLKYILPEPEEYNAETDDEDDENIDGHYFAGLTNSYVYGGLGWMSGTPGTIRNTGNPLNTFVGPFSNWPMPFAENLSIDPMGMSDESDEADEALESLLNVLPSDPASVWGKELPGQYQVGGYGSYHTGVVNFLFGDGSLQCVGKTVDLTVLQNMGNRSDGQIIELP